VPEDYAFDEQSDGSVRQVRLSELFEDGKDTLIVYSYMYGPRMAQSCTSCTLDSRRARRRGAARRATGEPGGAR
jgi:predicted dithiol-disulfide oxidoreductase (DUF899 family)